MEAQRVATVSDWQRVRWLDDHVALTHLILRGSQRGLTEFSRVAKKLKRLKEIEIKAVVGRGLERAIRSLPASIQCVRLFAEHRTRGYLLGLAVTRALAALIQRRPELKELEVDVDNLPGFVEVLRALSSRELDFLAIRGGGGGGADFSELKTCTRIKKFMFENGSSDWAGALVELVRNSPFVDRDVHEWFSHWTPAQLDVFERSYTTLGIYRTALNKRVRARRAVMAIHRTELAGKDGDCAIRVRVVRCLIGRRER